MKKVTTAVAAVALALGSFGVAQAADQVGGGFWDHGVGGGKVWSNFYHGGKCHGSTAEGSHVAKSGKTAAGRWANASAPSRWWAVDKAYYNFC